MIMHPLDSTKRMTPRQLAKFIVAERGVEICYYWHEFYTEVEDQMTDRELELVEAEIHHQSLRVRKFLGLIDR